MMTGNFVMRMRRGKEVELRKAEGKRERKGERDESGRL